MSLLILILSTLVHQVIAVGASDNPAHWTIARIRELRQQVAVHDDLYYRQNTQQVSDSEYDSLRNELNQLEAAHPVLAQQAGEELQPFGDDRTSGQQEISHITPMLSLSKCYSLEDLGKFYDKLGSALGSTELRLRLEPKIDGVAVNVIYEKGCLKHVISRGNGATGSDLTQQVKMTGCLPEKLPNNHGELPGLIELRGEAYFPLPDFIRLNESNETSGRPAFATPRNLAAGTLRLQDLSAIAERGLHVVIFSPGGWLPETTLPHTEQAFHELIKNWGIPIIEQTVVEIGKADLINNIERFSAQWPDWDYPADGIVVELENYDERARLGTGHSGPNWATAYKFPSPSSPTVLREILWQTGSKGRVTPVGLFDPVILDGRTVRRASLYSAAYVSENGFQVGDPIVVELRGHAIPVIRKTGDNQQDRYIGK